MTTLQSKTLSDELRAQASLVDRPYADELMRRAAGEIERLMAALSDTRKVVHGIIEPWLGVRGDIIPKVIQQLVNVYNDLHSYAVEEDIGKIVECLELFAPGTLPGYDIELEGHVWRVNRPMAQWDFGTEERIGDEPFISDSNLMPIGSAKVDEQIEQSITV